MPSRTFIATEEKSIPDFKVAKDRLPPSQRLMQLVIFKLKPMLKYHLTITGPLIIMLNLPCLCSKGTTKPG